MIKGFTIDNYYDGYKTSDINCVDLPIAACTGHFNRDNYFYYCLCYSYLLNWVCSFDDDWFEIRSRLLSLLGLEFKKIKVDSETELFHKVIQCMKEEHPVIFIVKYGSLFYSRYYKWGTFNHGLIINDFNDEYKIFGIRDREVIREHIDSGIFSSDVMHRIQVDYDQLFKIWEKSNTLFEEEQSIHYHTFYSINRANDHEVTQIRIQELLLHILNEDKLPMVNQFEKYIWGFKEKLLYKIQITKQEDETIRRVFHRSFITFFDVINKYLLTGELKYVDCSAINSSFEVFLKFRLDTINKLQLYSLRNMQIADSDLQNIIRQDSMLFTNIKKDLLDLLNTTFS